MTNVPVRVHAEPDIDHGDVIASTCRGKTIEILGKHELILHQKTYLIRVDDSSNVLVMRCADGRDRVRDEYIPCHFAYGDGMVLQSSNNPPGWLFAGLK